MKRLEDFVPADHPLRPVRLMVNEALVRLDSLFAGMYASSAKCGRPSIAPEKLLRAMLLQVFYSIRSERQLMEQVQYNLLYRWFIGLSMDDAVWVPTVFSKNRERLIEQDAVIALFHEVVEIADGRGWLSGEHFSVDRTLSRPGPGTRASSARTAMTRTATISVDSPAAMTRTFPPAMRMRGCIVRAIRPANCATSGIS
ncbi:ISXoo14 transposase [Xanthomonas translucens DAR61454]|nr:ISXoo14 transposase [Xanthomonas translucens DAR61454]